MKIGQPPDNSIQAQVGSSAATQKAVQKTNSAPANNAAQNARSAGVAVSVSTLARGLEKTGPTEAGVINTQKVATVKAAIADRSYVVNPEAIADKLLSNAQEMLRRPSR